jgi:hypothetical protein
VLPVLIINFVFGDIVAVPRMQSAAITIEPSKPRGGTSFRTQLLAVFQSVSGPIKVYGRLSLYCKVKRPYFKSEARMVPDGR